MHLSKSKGPSAFPDCVMSSHASKRATPQERIVQPVNPVMWQEQDQVDSAVSQDQGAHIYKWDAPDQSCNLIPPCPFRVLNQS